MSALQNCAFLGSRAVLRSFRNFLIKNKKTRPNRERFCHLKLTEHSVNFFNGVQSKNGGSDLGVAARGVVHKERESLFYIEDRPPED